MKGLCHKLHRLPNPWLPPDAVIRPRFFPSHSVSIKCSSRGILKEPVGWRFSSLRNS